MFRSEDICR